MTHRVEQILDAIVALMPTTSSNFKHRTLSLSEVEGELPARAVNLGEDVPPDDDGVSNFAFFDSLVTIEIAHKLQASTEADALTELIAMRTGTHIALMADDTLGLAFVISTVPVGADAPAHDAVKEYVAGVYLTRWRVHYRMNKSDPS